MRFEMECMGRTSYRLLFTGLFFCITLIGIGGFQHSPVLISTHDTVTEDSIPISYNIYYPPDLDRLTPVVIMGHGVNVNKEMMSNFAVEIASRGYIVANLDWRGHGRSGGELDRNGLTLDLEAVVGDIPHHTTYADMDNLALLGYSMGGFPTYQYAADHSTVKAWIGVGTAADRDISTMNDPENVLMVIATHDEAVSPEAAKQSMIPLTGRDLEDIAFNTTYGDIDQGTARRLQVVPWADHLTTPWDSDFVLAVTSWVSETFTGTPLTTVKTFNFRVLYLCIGLCGLLGLLGTVSWACASYFSFHPQERSIEYSGSLMGIILRYYGITLICIPTLVILLPLFLTPLPFTALIAVLTGGLGINLGIFSWRFMKSRDQSIRSIIRTEIMAPKKIWIFSLGMTAIYMILYHHLVGLNFLGVIPSGPKLPYLILYCCILFGVFILFSLFIQKVARPILRNFFHNTHDTLTDIIISFMIFVLIHSWFSIVILIPCIIMGNYFLAMILILMVPIFLFMSFFGVYMEKITGSIIPNAVLQAVWLGFIITTLTPFMSILAFIH